MSIVLRLGQHRALQLGSGLLALHLLGCEGVLGNGGRHDGGEGGGGGGGLGPGAHLRCPAGHLPLDDGSCLAPGVPADGCAPGFSSDGEAGCTAIMPDRSCESGSLAVPGDTDCRPVAPCGLPPWGTIPVEVDTQYVDISYPGGNSDGTESRPWRTVQEGVTAAATGAVVAIATGTYTESVLLDHPVRLWGVCPANARITSPSGQLPAVAINAAAGGAELHGLAVSGAAVGVHNDGAADVLLEQVWLHFTSSFGLAQTGAAAQTTLRASLVEAASDFGVHSTGGSLIIEQSAVRATASGPGGDNGVGVYVGHDVILGPRPSLTVRASLLSENYTAALVTAGAEGVVEDSLVDETQPQASDSNGGAGLVARRHGTSGERAHLTVRGSVLKRNRDCGVCISDSELLLERTVVRETDAVQSTGDAGHGIRVIGTSAEPSERATAVLRQSTLDHNRVAALAITGAEVDAEALLLRETRSRVRDDLLGRGVVVEPNESTDAPAELTMRGGWLERNRECGVAVYGSVVSLDAIAVVDTRPRPIDALFGIGLLLQVSPDGLNASQATVRRSVIDDAHTAGVLVIGANASFEHVAVRDIQRQPVTQEFGDGIAGSGQHPLLPSIPPTVLELRHVTVAECVRAGLSSFGAVASVSSSVFDCNGVDLDGEPLGGTPHQLTDLGNNVCGCGEVLSPCSVQSSGIDSPAPPAP